jgi:hypothetical protein
MKKFTTTAAAAVFVVKLNDINLRNFMSLLYYFFLPHMLTRTRGGIYFDELNEVEI